MKKLNLLLLFLPLFINAQYGRAVKFQNTVRAYYNMQELSTNRQLKREAQSWANYIAVEDQLILSSDTYGESLYRFNKNDDLGSRNYYLDAAVAWFEANNTPEYYQQLCYSCTEVGFGMAESDEYIYVVAKYDKIYD